MLFSSSPKDKIILLVNIQSSVIHSAIAHIKEKGKSEIVYIGNQSIPFQPHLGTAQLIKLTLKALDDSIDKAMRFVNAHSNMSGHAVPTIDEVHYVLASPWIVSRAYTISESFPKPVITSEKGVLAMVARERAKYIKSISAPVEIVEEKVFDVKINEYSITKWAGKSTNKVDVSMANSIAGTVMIRKFTEACSSIVKSKEVHFHSSLLLQHIGIQSVIPNESDYVLIHAHGELTDVVVVEKKTCVFFGSFPRGVNTAIRSLSRSLNATLEIADSLLNMEGKDQVDKAYQKNSESAVKNLADDWVIDFKALFSGASYQKSLPKSFIVSARAHEDFFVKAIVGSYPGSKIKILSIDQVDDFISYAPQVETQRLIGLYTLAIQHIGMF